ncbi:LysM peptidoglycan-binding domain-containing protein, partial [Streptomyces chryseus]
MPAKGKHRRPRSNPLTRGFAAAGAGGAVLALPLIAATGANAAEKAAPAAASTGKAVAPAAAEKAAPQKKAGTKTYSVVSGDYLSKIADEQDVRGGWQKLYEDNREVVGGNPSLILPGMKLTIGAKAAAPAKPAPAKA